MSKIEVGTRFEMVFDKSPFDRYNGEWEVQQIDKNDIDMPYFARHKKSGMSLWFTPKLELAVVHTDDQTSTRLN